MVETYAQAEALVCIVGRMLAIEQSSKVSMRTARAIARMLADTDAE
jgi:hypothetical protein